MSEACRLLRPSIVLYAEDELRSSPQGRRVVRHLERCAACREFLARYDALTRRILCEGAPSPVWGDPDEGDLQEHLRASARRRLVLDRIRSQPLPLISDERRRFPVRLMGAAAAVLALGYLLHFFLPFSFFFSGSTSGSSDHGGDLGVVRAATVTGPRSAVPRLPPLGQIRWLRQVDVDRHQADVLRARKRPGYQWIYGMARDLGIPRPGPSEHRRGNVLRWAVEVGTVDSSASFPRFLLVREDVLQWTAWPDADGTAQRLDDLIREVVLRQVFELPSISPLRLTGDAEPLRSYRVLPVTDSRGLLPASLSARESEIFHLLWQGVGFPERGRSPWYPAELASPAGPRS